MNKDDILKIIYKVFTKVIKKYLNTSMYLVFKYICKKYLVFKYILSMYLVFKYKKSIYCPALVTGDDYLETKYLCRYSLQCDAF